MKPEFAIEVYRQRFETFRHLNRLRSQMLQIAVAIGTFSLAFGNSSSDAPEWWIVQIGGVLLIGLGAIIEQINASMRDNHKVLSIVARVVGDTAIPDSFSRVRSVAFWVTVLLGILGIGCILWGWQLRDS